jgi:hypothetical protein
MRIAIGALVVLLSACASAPQPQCMPPNVTRAPDASGDFGPVPQADAGADEEYARCKEREAEDRLEAQLREEEARAKKREAEQLERELQEMEEQDK